MSDSQHDRVSKVFLAVCDLEGDDQRQELVRLCEGDGELCSEVLQLLGFDDEPAAIDAPAYASDLALAAMKDASSRADPDVPATVGAYRILDVLGEGGMGVVYRARQSNPDRVVALKILRPGLVTPELRLRFEFEAEILGRLQHPGIAQIYESGHHASSSGERPYFAMELVRGAAITDYAREAALSTRQRLQLMIKLCDAVQHAHERGVIHRDLKPANVLVDPLGQPKVLDFGVSRATEPGGTASHRTQTGVLVGTVAYMSTEQLRGDHASVDTRSDVYSLGVILFELLTGELPYPVVGEPLHVAVKLILDGEPRSAGALLPAARGDVETIVRTALAKDKGRVGAGIGAG